MCVLTGRSAGTDSLAKLDYALRQAVDRGTGTLSVIIRVEPGERDAVRRHVERSHGRVTAEHELINALTVEIAVDELVTISRHPAIDSLSIDAIVSGQGGPSSSGGTPRVSALRATLGLSGASPTGTAVGVAIIDSGIELSPDFDGRVRAFYDYVNANGAFVNPYDDYGHGNHVAGSIGGDGDLSRGEFRGIAPGISFIVLKVLGRDGSGTTSNVIRALEFVVKNRAALGVDVINLSLGHPIYEPAATDPLVQAVEAAVRAGIVVVASAGNFGVNRSTGLTGYAGVTSPGNAPSAITVGALKTNDTIARSDDVPAPYSSRGPTWCDGFAKPDLLAPGHGIVSNTARGSYLFKSHSAFRYGTSSGSNSNLMRLSGTSMATAVTSGVAALTIAASRAANPQGPALPPNAVKAVLQFTAQRLRDGSGVEYDYLTQGAGALNAAGAITLARAINTAAPVGSWWLVTGVAPSTTIAGQTFAWAQNIIWGYNVVWGNAVYTNAPAWTANIVWGYVDDDNIVWGYLGDNIIWGYNVVWGDNIIWGYNIVWGNHLIGATSSDNITWGYAGDEDSIVWGNLDDENITWGYNIVWGNNLVGSLLVLTPDGL